MFLKSLVGCVLVLVVGCSMMSSFPSAFFNNFSLHELAQRNRSLTDLSCAGGGGSGGIGTGGGGIGRRESNFNKGESFSCQLGNAEEFDEAVFIQTLKQSVEADLVKMKAQIVSSEMRSKTSFSIEYTVENASGKVDISGKMYPQNYYSLQSELAERVEVAK